MVQRVDTKCYKLARYLQRNVRANWLALRMTLGLYLPIIPSNCVTARCLNNKHNVFFVAEKAIVGGAYRFHAIGAILLVLKGKSFVVVEAAKRQTGSANSYKWLLRAYRIAMYVSQPVFV